ncbi:UNVERIFIED_CONTAM: hypothetical protein RMT77_017961 [Armadillidium vulgare]
MTSETSSSLCGFSLTESCLTLGFLLTLTGFLQLIYHVLDLLPKVGLLCIYGGCSFDDGTSDSAFTSYNIINAIIYVLAGIAFVAGILRSNVRLLSAYTALMGLNIVLTIIIFIITTSTSRNYLALSYLFIANTITLFLKVFLLYAGVKFFRKLTCSQRNLEYLQLSNLCLIP